MVKGVCKAIQLQGVLVEMGISGALKPVHAFCDNIGVWVNIVGDRVALASKHSANKIHWLRDMKNLGVFTPHHCDTDDQAADLGTKVMDKRTFQSLIDLNMGYDYERLHEIIKMCSVDFKSKKSKRSKK